MSETSREFWRDPAKYSRTEAETNYGTPCFYLSAHNERTSETIEKVFAHVGVQKTWSILEVGCNCGRNIDYLQGAGYLNVSGVEINPAAVEYAWGALPDAARTMTVSDAQSFLAMKPPRSYGIIFTQGVLMHVPPEDDYLFRQMARVASKGILTCEVEVQAGELMRHKFNRNYRDVFEGLGLAQIGTLPERRRTIRIFAI